MNDSISRKDAIALVDRPIVPTGDAVYDNAREDERASIKDDLLSLPSADRPIGEWIPVSKKLPESGEYCLVAWVYQHEECPYQHYYGLSSFDTDNPGWNTIGKDDNKIDILAWMPLPEPYREDSEA